MKGFTRDTTVFKDEDVLRDSYKPDELLERDDEWTQYLEALTPVINGDEPNNALVYGQTGVGKTLASGLILDHLEDDAEGYDDIDVKHVWVNCQGSSSYQTAISIINSLRSDTKQLSKTGYPKEEVLDTMWSEINNVDATHVIIVLDEVDGLGTDDELLYQLPRAKANGHVSETEVGTIGISNNFRFREKLSPKVKDSLCETEIHFQAYSVEQLTSILEQRAEEAFYDDVLDFDVIPLVAALAGNDTGSARHAIDILHKAGSIARRDGDDGVTEKHARMAEEQVERGRIIDELRTLPTQSHLVLLALMRLEQHGETPAQKMDIYDVYKKAAESAGLSVKSTRTVHNRLSDLALSGFITVAQVNVGNKGGKFNHYQLDMNMKTIESVLAEETDL